MGNYHQMVYMLNSMPLIYQMKQSINDRCGTSRLWISIIRELLHGPSSCFACCQCLSLAPSMASAVFAGCVVLEVSVVFVLL